jgi:nitrogen-specific signal transduction histidine kinase
MNMQTSFVAPSNPLTDFDMVALPGAPATLPSEPMAALGTVLEALQEAACIVDEELQVRGWNAAMSRLTGLPKDQALLQSLFSLFPKNFKQGLEKTCREAFAHAQTKVFSPQVPAPAWDGEIQQFHGLNVFLTFRYRLSMLETDNPRPLGMLTLCDVRHERLLKKQFECREQLSLLGMLNASVAQELSGALDSICHKLDDILKSTHAAGSGKRAEEIEEIIPQVYRIGYLTNNIVSLGRDIAPQLVYLNVNEALQETLGLLEQTQKKKISCVTAFTPSLPSVAADPALLQIVFQNVMKYALEAAGEDVVPRVHTTLAPDGDGTLIHIEDRGPQLDEDTLANFFDPAHTTARWGLVISLGLLLSKKIVEAHHGSFEVSSREGSGTKLTIFLPVDGHCRI